MNQSQRREEPVFCPNKNVPVDKRRAAGIYITLIKIINDVLRIFVSHNAVKASSAVSVQLIIPLLLRPGRFIRRSRTNRGRRTRTDYSMEFHKVPSWNLYK